MADQVPADALDRITEALARSLKYLDQEKQRKLQELLDVDTLVAFAVLLAIWAGLQLTPVGWAADLALAAWGAYGLATTLGELVSAAKAAAESTTDNALEAAAQRMARAMTDTVVDVIGVILGISLFSRLRSALRVVRSKVLPSGSRYLRTGERLPEPGSRAPGRVTALDVAVGAGVGVGLERAAPPVGKALSIFGTPWPYVIGGGLLMLGIGIALSARGSRPRGRLVHA